MSETNSYTWLKELNAGDKVIVHCWSWVGSSYFLEKVEKITPAGFIRVNGNLYRSDDGHVRSRDFNAELCNPECPKAVLHLQEYRKQCEILQVVNAMRDVKRADVSYEQALKVKEIMGW